MTNRIAVILAAAIAVFIALDLVFDWGAALFLARKFTDLIEWLAFWR